MILPPEAHPLVQVLALHFTSPTYQRFSTLLVGGHPHHRPANRRQPAPHPPAPRTRAPHRLPARPLPRTVVRDSPSAARLARFLLDHFVPDGPVTLVGDDTVDGHPGKHVYGKARHRDPVRSTHAYTAWRYGHKWVVLAVLVKFPFATRPWALPVLVDLYRSEEDDRRPTARTAPRPRLMCRLLRLVLIRFPDRTFVFVEQ